MATPPPIHGAGPRPAAMGSVLRAERRPSVPLPVSGPGGPDAPAKDPDELRPGGLPW